MRHFSLLLISFLLLAVSCGISPYAGGVSDHGNERVAGIVTGKDGTPVPGVAVTLLPDEYNPVADSQRVDERKAVTDSCGRYIFDGLVSGVYALQAFDERGRGAGIAKGVAVAGNNDSAPAIRLNATGSIYLPVDSMDLTMGMVIYLPGTRRYETIDSTRKVTMFDVPAGLVTVRAYDPADGAVKELGSEFIGVEVLPGVTLLLPSRSPQPYCLKDDRIVACEHGYAGEVFTFSPIHPSKKIDGNYVYRFSWGEGTISGWSSNIRWEWSWDRPGDYFVQSQVMRQGSYLAWSDYIYIRIEEKE